MFNFLPRPKIIFVALSIFLVSCAGAPPIPDALPRFDRSASDNVFPDSEYPPSSRRLGEVGVAIIEILVLEDGSVGKTQLIQSSGFPRLDEAALNWYNHHGKFLPGAKNGKTIAAWKPLKVTFKLIQPE